MIQFAHLYGKYWSCDCNRILHTKDDLHKHMKQHALERIKEIENDRRIS
jgi:hypothetical protein